MRLEPRYLSMVIPSRWMAGGRGLDEFRTRMLSGGHLRYLTDFIASGEAFPGVQIKGGICYFLWDAAYSGQCQVTRVASGEEHVQPGRRLDEFDVLVRDERALGILRKVLLQNEASIVELISGDTPFGIATNFSNWTLNGGGDSVSLHLIRNGKRLVGQVERTEVQKSAEAIDVWKVLVPKAYGAGESYPHQILGREIVAGPPSVCTQSYLTVSPFSSEEEARSFASYYRSRFLRFLVSLRKITQDALRSTYKWVPQQTWDRMWTDQALYEKYDISKDEVAYIESMIRPMGEGDE